MITRTTTVGTLKNYRYNLNRSNNTLASSMLKVETERKFNSYAESPTLASRCFQLRRSAQRATSQYTVNQSIAHKYDVAWQTMDRVTTDLYKITDDTEYTSIIRALNDPDGSGRNALGQSMVAKARSMAQTMNNTYGENYVFAGADHLNAPFTWEAQENPDYIAADKIDVTNPDHAKAFQYMIDPANAVNGELYTNDPALANQVPEPNPYYDKEFTENATADDVDDPKYGQYLTPDGKGTTNAAIAALVPEENPDYNDTVPYKYLKADGSGTDDKTEARTVLCYRGVAVDSMSDDDKAKMEYYLKEETRNVDVGLGFKENDGEAVSSTVFQSALQGIYYLGGYGTEMAETTLGEGASARTVKAEVPNNVISICQRMGEILLNCSSEDGEWASDEEKEEFAVLASKFEDTISVVGQRYAELTTDASFLKDNSELLQDVQDSLNDQIVGLEAINPAEAIMDYMYARYCYDAALKIGNSVLSQSLMDYMSF